jgi:hypothetical protein
MRRESLSAYPKRHAPPFVQSRLTFRGELPIRLPSPEPKRWSLVVRSYWLFNFDTQPCSRKEAPTPHLWLQGIANPANWDSVGLRST